MFGLLWWFGTEPAVSLRFACILSWNLVMFLGATEVSKVTCPIANGPDCCAVFGFCISFYLNIFVIVVVPGPLLLGFLLSARYTVLPSLLSIWVQKCAPSNLLLRQWF